VRIPSATGRSLCDDSDRRGGKSVPAPKRRGAHYPCSPGLRVIVWRWLSQEVLGVKESVYG
jgi:hypothetical protein